MDFIRFAYARFSQGIYLDSRQASLLALRSREQILRFNTLSSTQRRTLLLQAGAHTGSEFGSALLDHETWDAALACLQDQWHARQGSQYAPFWDTLGWQPSQEQKAAIVSPESRAILVAAAGAGKTSTLLARIAFLTHAATLPDKSILVLAFNRAVRKEITQRLPAHTQRMVVVHTFHSLAWDILRQVYPAMTTRPDTETESIAISDCLACLRAMEQAPGWRTTLQGIHAPRGLRRWLPAHTRAGLDPVLATRIVRDFSRLAEQGGMAPGLVDPLCVSAGAWQDRSGTADSYGTVATAALQQHLLTRFSHMQASYLAMIPLAMYALSHSSYTNCFHHIFVDEYQDVSPARTRLLQAMLDHNPSARMAVVGDDWQSIYGFTGSRHDALQGFGLDYGPHRRYPLQRSFRFPNAVAELAGTFIQQNPDQIHKQVCARDDTRDDHIVFVQTASGYGPQACHATVQALAQAWQPGTNQSLGILLRYNRSQSIAEQAAAAWPGPTTVTTIHKAKGLEWDFCLIWDLIQGDRGFPGTRSRGNEAIDYAEERRLMYVALTRCRTGVGLAYPPRKASRFVKELRRRALPATSRTLRLQA